MNEPRRMSVSAELKDLAPIRHFVEGAAVGGGASPEAVADMVTALNEATTNIVLHGYRGRSGFIEVEVGFDGDALVVHLRDQAPAFDPFQVPPPDTSLPLEQRSPGGVGILMIRQLTDEMVYRMREDGSNELVLVKRHARDPA
ncbi:ATP-binding protein [Chloroflexota bacterium]